jgi:hypothetical protein
MRLNTAVFSLGYLMSFKTRVKRWFHAITASPTEVYLCQSVDRHDLEHRMQRVQYGTAPFQRHDRSFGSDRGKLG